MSELIKQELRLLLADMEVPPDRVDDLGWLSRNLGIRNRNHKNYPLAEELIKKLRKAEA